MAGSEVNSRPTSTWPFLTASTVMRAARVERLELLEREPVGLLQPDRAERALRALGRPAEHEGAGERSPDGRGRRALGRSRRRAGAEAAGVGLLPPDVHAPTTSASSVAPRAALRMLRMGPPSVCSADPPSAQPAPGASTNGQRARPMRRADPARRAAGARAAVHAAAAGRPPAARGPPARGPPAAPRPGRRPRDPGRRTRRSTSVKARSVDDRQQRPRGSPRPPGAPSPRRRGARSRRRCSGPGRRRRPARRASPSPPPGRPRCGPRRG